MVARNAGFAAGRGRLPQVPSEVTAIVLSMLEHTLHVIALLLAIPPAAKFLAKFSAELRTERAFRRMRRLFTSSGRLSSTSQASSSGSSPAQLNPNRLLSSAVRWY